jgi:tRNA(adenine34) deaminase
VTEQEFMREALREAERAAAAGEVPVGAIIACDGRIIARAHNEIETRNDATAHAEILAIQNASRELGNWRLSSCALFVTLEPCPMCIGAMILSRVKSLYFAASDPRLGAVGSRFDLTLLPDLPHRVEVYPDLLRGESEQLLRRFFSTLRAPSVPEDAPS